MRNKDHKFTGCLTGTARLVHDVVEFTENFTYFYNNANTKGIIRDFGLEKSIASLRILRHNPLVISSLSRAIGCER